jgi:hypothetical protein
LPEAIKSITVALAIAMAFSAIGELVRTSLGKGFGSVEGA